MGARLLLIEDDPSIARFVGLALEELPHHDPAAPAIELHRVSDLAGARAALAGGGWQLVISDLMLPDGSAEALLAEGHALGRAAPPWLIFSAGLHAERQQALLASGVARTLRKPVPLMELLGVVAGLLRPAGPPAPPPEPAVDPVQQHFGGDRVLYESFRASCLERFADDIAQGDAALAGGDIAGLRRVAHGLKAVLALIGQPELSCLAHVLEDGAAAWVPGAPPPAGWPALAKGLAALGR